MPEIAAGFETPTKFLGVVLLLNQRIIKEHMVVVVLEDLIVPGIFTTHHGLFAYGTHPDGNNQGGGSGNRTGGKGGLGTSCIGGHLIEDNQVLKEECGGGGGSGKTLFLAMQEDMEVQV